MRDYKPPILHRSAHFSTIVPNRLRRVVDLTFDREQFDTPDGDFIDLDISSVKSQVGVILLHGLEGSSHSNYIKAMAKLSNTQGWDAIAMNFRSCSGRPNNLISSYHSGISADLESIVHKLSERYTRLYIIGFSLGGNVALKWAGEAASNNYYNVRAVLGISVPCDLEGSGQTLGKRQNFVYLNRFLKQLKAKALEKLDRFPEIGLDRKRIARANSFREFDDAYTAPVHGFESAEDYYHRCSSRSFIPDIQVPTLIINAKNDSFLSPSCYPFKEAEENENVTLLTPSYGGHVGFASNHRMNKPFWHEKKMVDFIELVEKSSL